MSRGADIAYASDLPADAGMSSSSTLVVATFIALSKTNDLRSNTSFRNMISSGEELAAYLGAVENGRPFRQLSGDEGVGTFGGNQDQTAILCSRAGALVQYRFAPVHFERSVPLPHDHVFVIGSSGVLAEKTGAALELYNRQARRVYALLDRWRAATGRNDATLGAVLESSPDALARLEQIVRDPAMQEVGDGFDRADLIARLEQFATEANEIIPAAGDALERGDLETLGELVDRSQRGAEVQLGNQVVARSEDARVMVGPQLLGRVIDGFGLPMDGGPTIEGGEPYSLYGTARSPMEREQGFESRTTAFSRRQSPQFPVGRLPTGAGKLPALPIFKTRSNRMVNAAACAADWEKLPSEH